MRSDALTAPGLKTRSESSPTAALPDGATQRAAGSGAPSNTELAVALPDWRVLLEGDAGHLVGHAGFGLRGIDVEGKLLRIAGVGAVCTAPSVQRTGRGRHLFSALRHFLHKQGNVDFAFLECREAIVPFYEAVGFTRFDQVVWCLDPDSAAWGESIGPKLVMPVGRDLDAWPRGGRIDLRGMPW